HQVLGRPAGGDARERSSVHRGRNTADRKWGRGSVVRGVGGAGDLRRRRRIQGGGGEEHGSGIHQSVDPDHHHEERGGSVAVRRGIESGISARRDGGYGFSLSRSHRGGGGERTGGGSDATALRAADQWMVLRAGRRDSATGSSHG